MASLFPQYVGDQSCFSIVWRYVDNRVILMSDNAKKTPAVQTLLRDDFYIPPVELEIVNDNYFSWF